MTELTQWNKRKSHKSVSRAVTCRALQHQVPLCQLQEMNRTGAESMAEHIQSDNRCQRWERGA